MILCSFLFLLNELLIYFDPNKPVDDIKSYDDLLFVKKNPSDEYNVIEINQDINSKSPEIANQNMRTHILLKGNDESSDQYYSSDGNVPPLLPTRATEEIIHRDSGDSVRFKVVTYVGLAMIIVILCLFIVWKFCPHSCFCDHRQNEDINGDIGIESGINDGSSQLQIDTIDQNEINLDIAEIQKKENINEDQNEKEIKDV